MAILFTGYTLCWDNVAKYTSARHHSQESDNKLNLWDLAYIAKNRIPTITLRDKTTIHASCIAVENFMPFPSDFDLLKERLEVIIKRILSKFLVVFIKQKVKADEPFMHKKYHESTNKSEIVTVGMFNENLSTTAGVIRILDKLHKFVPLLPEMESVDSMDTLLNPKSAVQKGTLSYLRNIFNHRGAKKEVKNCFSQSIEFLYFVTEAYLCLHAVEILDLTDLKDRELREDPENALDNITKEILSRVWVEPDTTSITGSNIRMGYCL
ncbi:Hypothetical predicted protein [Mytilus galloprovincialis]|uniref:Uncharacterized protein n=1 Tax=Mytilus galloprovincialis TaxID=29158 RepID=A0A8B6E579_MYTGA|nr:Hypothetical predicted protein [Mytilus galloprovincialis]